MMGGTEDEMIKFIDERSKFYKVWVQRMCHSPVLFLM